MDFLTYLKFFKRWAWLIVLGVILGTIGGFYLSRYQEPIYQSATKVLILRAPEDVSSAVSSVSDQQLQQTFTELIVTRPVLQETGRILGYNVSANQISVQQVGEAELIQVVAQDSNPQRAADIANTIVSVFLTQNEALQASRFASSEESLQAQIQQVEGQIASLETQLTDSTTENLNTQIDFVTKTISNLQQEISDLQTEVINLDYSGETYQDYFNGRLIEMTPTPSIEQRIERQEKDSRLGELNALLGLYQRIYVDLSISSGSGNTTSRSAEQLQATLVLYREIHSNLLSNYEAIRLARLKSTPNIIQVEEAIPAKNPISPNQMFNVIIGAVFGLVLFGGIALFLELSDDTLRTREDVTEILNLPILGLIGEMDRASKRKSRQGKPYVLNHPRAPISDAFRYLRANLELMNPQKPLCSLLVTSPDISVGKTTIVVNLAIVFAYAGKNVFLIDADLRKPQVHKAFGLPNLNGLAELLHDSTQIKDVSQPILDHSLQVITSGKLPPDPSEVISTTKLGQVLGEMRKNGDMVIVDGPPLLLPDASVLASRVDAVLVVIQLNRTKAKAALDTIDQLNRAGVKIAGIVLNRVRTKDTSYYHKHLKRYYSLAYDK